ncbi:hypothetical protein ACFY94_38195 [Streptomyces griseorubiginosus]|uniref:hypothetical protein n=1 Tax=Streptomyces griseorubiginosus TaxID=67304 RepID=UPI0036ED8AA4
MHFVQQQFLEGGGGEGILGAGPGTGRDEDQQRGPQRAGVVGVAKFHQPGTRDGHVIRVVSQRSRVQDMDLGLGDRGVQPAGQAHGHIGLQPFDAHAVAGFPPSQHGGDARQQRLFQGLTPLAFGDLGQSACHGGPFSATFRCPL